MKYEELYPDLVKATSRLSDKATQQQQQQQQQQQRRLLQLLDTRPCCCSCLNQSLTHDCVR